ncbi:glycosyltransferase family 4 protein [Hyphomicrobium sp. LHD-15]|uniref:glycosyltransferase family 4 protein n=1 Tax=Hyphomicrobium sp. LHD-15 TaxID=3072142 RepID=UPI00280CB13B|nr:glycosyltransferase family 4 protein [Hyphomicrobium sp. LHD-15]MDQ8698149.1 glycosyltransferase family 4 protein [Hyphomicrobium sp. LHD-15]
MRIAQVAPLAESVPPKLYGGTERVVSWLTEELVRQGHEVTLFASGDSETSATLVPCCSRGLRLGGVRDHLATHLVMLSQVMRAAEDFDIIHFHVDLLQHLLFNPIRHKTITTMHGRLDLPDNMPIYKAFPCMPMVSISNHQRLPMPAFVDWVDTIPHGLPSSLCTFNQQGGDYLAFLGRICRDKRPDRAIEIAKRTGIPLKIAAKVDPADTDYFEQVIRQMLDHPLIEFIGEIDDQQKGAFLGNALALLFPIDWPEPFGLVMIEAMSVGTPVIAWRAGSVPEIITEGVSGYIVDSIEEGVAAVGKSLTLNRAVVRQAFEKRFTVEKMTGAYVEAYRRQLALTSDIGLQRSVALAAE